MSTSQGRFAEYLRAGVVDHWHCLYMYGQWVEPWWRWTWHLTSALAKAGLVHVPPRHPDAFWGLGHMLESTDLHPSKPPEPKDESPPIRNPFHPDFRPPPQVRCSKCDGTPVKGPLLCAACTEEHKP